MAKKQFEIGVILTIKASTYDEAVSIAWGVLQDGYVENAATAAPPKALKAVEIDACTVAP